jgi:signal peptidase I
MRMTARLGVALLLTLMAAAAIAGPFAWHAGYRIYAVRTGSMTPAYPVGSLLVDGPVTHYRPDRGDVVTFETPAGPVTHRVHAVVADGIETKGDANRTPDIWMVRPTHIVGRVIQAIPRGGYVLVFLQQPTGVPSLVLFALSTWLAWSLFFTAAEPATTERAPRHGTTPVAV